MDRDRFRFNGVLWFGYFLIYLGVCFFLPDSHGVDWRSSMDDVRVAEGVADGLIGNAEFLLEHGGFGPWSSLFRPPGTSLIIAAILKFTGKNYYVLKSNIISAFLWACALLAIQHTITFFRSPLKCFLLINSIWLFSGFRNSITSEWGPVWPESKGFPLFLLSMSFLILGVRQAKRQHYITAAFLMGITAYFHYLFDVVGSIMFMAMALMPLLSILMFLGAQPLLASRPRSFSDWFAVLRSPILHAHKQNLSMALLLLLFFHATIMPWKIRNHTQFGHYGIAPPVTANLWFNHWAFPERAVYPASNTACLVDFQLCEILDRQSHMMHLSIARNLVLATMVGHPLLWAKARLRALSYLWVGLPWKISSLSDVLRYAEGVFLLLSLLAGICLLWQYRGSSAQFRMFTCFIVGFLIYSAIIVAIIHFEFRYSLSLRFFSFFLPFWVLSFALNPSQSDDPRVS